ncbi:MAG: glycosyltransferase family 2 protein [Methanobacteriaceae archaeon]|nr:glycosyltransferase family 2 protein [Methanobacteriaceae archaeon]
MTNNKHPTIKKKIYIILPSYNEEKTLEEVVEELVLRGFNILIIDDGSSDNTSVIGQKLKNKYKNVVFYYRHMINIGLGGAIKTGIKAGLEKGADILITFDADGQHNPDDLYNIYPPLQDDEADVVIGARNFQDMPTSRRYGNSLMNFVTFIFQGHSVKDSQSGLRGFNRYAAESLNINSPQYGVSSEIIGEIKRKNFRFKEVPMTTIYDEHTIQKGTNTMVGIKIVIEFLNNMFR